MSAIGNGQLLELWKCESRTLTITIVDPDTGFPVALDAGIWEIDDLQFQVKTDVEVADPAVLSKALGSGITLLTQIGDTIGQAEVDIVPADTAELAAGPYKFDIVAIFSSGKRIYVVKPEYLTLNGVVNPTP